MHAKPEKVGTLTAICVICEKSFELIGVRRNAKCCSKECTRKRNNRKSHVRQMAKRKERTRLRNSLPQICDFCESEYVRPKQTKYCGAKCGSDAQNKKFQCAECGLRSYSEVCQKCRTNLNAIKRAESQIVRRHCRWCDEVFIVGQQRKFCSVKCRLRFDQHHWPANHRRRARKYGVPYDSTVTELALLQRFGAGCSICGELLLGGVPGNHPDGTVIEHIIPLSVIGSPGHVWGNVQLAHHRCNNKKYRSDDWPLILASIRERRKALSDACE